MNDMVKPATLRVPYEVSAYTRLGLRPVRAAAADGSLATVRIGKFRIARIEAVETWLKSMEKSQPTRRAKK